MIKIEIVDKTEVVVEIEILKKDLERYYIKEKKSIAEISRIYECDRRIIKRRLKKYKISIRPKGAFLVDEDGETLMSKYNRGEISVSEYQKEWSKINGFDSYMDYRNKLAKRKGYENYNDYTNKMNHKSGKYLSMSENRECPLYLGVYIAERILSLLFKNVEKMPDGNPGYDFICDNDYKIDSKGACLSSDGRWLFTIRKNKIADYFFMIAFDDRENLKVEHIWLIKSDVVIEKIACNSEEFIVNEKHVIHISRGNISLKRFEKYEKTYLLEKAQKICDNFKNINEQNK